MSEHVIDLEGADLSPEAARYLLSLDFPGADRQRLEELESKARTGTLTAAEQDDLTRYRHMTQLLEQLRAKAHLVLGVQVAQTIAVPPSLDVPPGILRSQQAFWRDLPKLLQDKKNHGKWVCYHGDECVGIANSDEPLIRECLQRKIQEDQYDLFIVKSRTAPPWEPEEVEALGPWHFEDRPQYHEDH